MSEPRSCLRVLGKGNEYYIQYKSCTYLCQSPSTTSSAPVCCRISRTIWVNDGRMFYPRLSDVHRAAGGGGCGIVE